MNQWTTARCITTRDQLTRLVLCVSQIKINGSIHQVKGQDQRLEAPYRMLRNYRLEPSVPGWVRFNGSRLMSTENECRRLDPVPLVSLAYCSSFLVRCKYPYHGSLALGCGIGRCGSLSFGGVSTITARAYVRGLTSQVGSIRRSTDRLERLDRVGAVVRRHRLDHKERRSVSSARTVTAKALR